MRARNRFAWAGGTEGERAWVVAAVATGMEGERTPVWPVVEGRADEKTGRYAMGAVCVDVCACV